MINPDPARWVLVCALALVGVLTWRDGEPDEGDRAAVIFLCWAAASIAWSPDRVSGVYCLSNLMAGVVLFIWAKRIPDIPLIACAALVVHFIIFLYVPAIYGGMGNENFEAEFLVITSAVLFFGAWHYTGVPRLLCMAGMCYALVQIGLVNTSNAKYAALAALVAWAAWRWDKRLLALGIGLAALLAWSEPGSILSRFELAFNTALAWLDYPVFGYGLGGFDYVYPFYAEKHLPYTGETIMDGLQWYAGAAHNEYVQLLAELGIVGGFFAAYALRTNVRTWGPIMPLAGLCLVGFPFQNASTAIAAAGLLGLASQGNSFQTSLPRWRSSLPFSAGLPFGPRRISRWHRSP